MKNTIIIFCLMIACNAFAEAPQGLSEKDMQSMMQNIGKVQTCMKNIDQSEIKALEQRSNKIQTELKSLCASGKHKAAQDKAVSFAKEISQMSSIKTIRECSEIIKSVMPKISMPDLSEDYTHTNVCERGL